jgi:DNA polymerase III delta prime subunit
MTHIVIHNSSQVAQEYLLTLAGKLLGRKIRGLDELGANPDFHALSKGKESIGIEDVKKLQKEMVYQPYQEQFQIGVIFNAHNLTTEAQNALLKTLEEQPATTEYILLVNNERNLLPTIISRGIRHYVKTGAPKKEARAGRPEVLDMDLIEQFTLIEKLAKEGGVDALLESLLRYFRDSLREGIKKGTEEKVVANRKGIETVTTAQVRLKANGNKKLVLENMMLHLQDI